MLTRRKKRKGGGELKIYFNQNLKNKTSFPQLFYLKMKNRGFKKPFCIGTECCEKSCDVFIIL